MAQPTKIVVHYDDGTTTEIPAGGVGSIFMNESAAVTCGHKPPYKDPPGPGPTPASATSNTTSGTTTATTMETKCYLINGIIVCP